MANDPQPSLPVYRNGRFHCPSCDSRDTHEHTLSRWCMNCGWVKGKHEPWMYPSRQRVVQLPTWGNQNV